jgi:hypothetical protein
MVEWGEREPVFVDSFRSPAGWTRQSYENSFSASKSDFIHYSGQFVVMKYLKIAFVSPLGPAVERKSEKKPEDGISALPAPLSPFRSSINLSLQRTRMRGAACRVWGGFIIILSSGSVCASCFMISHG